MGSRCTCGGADLCTYCLDSRDEVDQRGAGFRDAAEYRTGWGVRKRTSCEAYRPQPCGAPGPLVLVGVQLLCGRCVDETTRRAT